MKKPTRTIIRKQGSNRVPKGSIYEYDVVNDDYRAKNEHGRVIGIVKWETACCCPGLFTTVEK
jgi:hypothetical protein